MARTLEGLFLLSIMKNRVSQIYKYRAIDSNTFRILICDEIYFASPSQFNDPFDCNIVPIPWATYQEMEEFCRKHFPGHSDEEYQEMADKYVKKLPETIYKSLRADVDKMRKKLAICCFSQVNNSSLMYSHYADKHKGLCLEFKVSGHSFYDSLLQVYYPDEFPQIRFFKRDREAMLEAQVLKKQQEWKYEKEWRIIKVDEPGFYKFPSEFLTGIIFGLNTSDADMKLIQEMMQFKKSNMVWYKCEKAEDNFNLNIVPL